MDITPVISSDRKVIQSYSADGFRISDADYRTSVFVLPGRVIAWEGEGDALNEAAAFDALLEHADDIEVLLFGTGKTARYPSADVRKTLKGNGIVVEPMNTGAACRTFNVLMAEGRLVAAALLPDL